MFNFFLYGVIGWIIEEVYCFAVTGHFQEDGFLYGPFKPMYAIVMAILILLQDTFRLPALLLLKGVYFTFVFKIHSTRNLG